MDNPSLHSQTPTSDTSISSERPTLEPASSATRKVHTVIEPPSGFQALGLREVWQFRDLLIALASRDIKLRYRQTALGVVWVVLQPLIAAGILSFVFNRLAKLPTGAIPPLVFSFAGLLAWGVFNNTLTKCSTVLVQNAPLISKIFFPRLVLPLSTVFSTLLDFGVAAGMMVILMIVYGVRPGLGLLLLPCWLLLILMLALGLGLYAAALTVSYRDVQYVIPVVTQFLFFGSPIAYAVTAVPAHLRSIYYLNPLASLLEAFRWSLFGQGELQPLYLVYAAVVCSLTFVSGAYAFRNMERRFADVI